MAIWIGEIVITPEVEAKINAKHDVTADEVREAAAFGAAWEARWHSHPVYGDRLLVKGDTYQGRPLLVTLKELDETDGRWEYKTAREWKG